MSNLVVTIMALSSANNEDKKAIQFLQERYRECKINVSKVHNDPDMCMAIEGIPVFLCNAQDLSPDSSQRAVAFSKKTDIKPILAIYNAENLEDADNAYSSIKSSLTYGDRQPTSYWTIILDLEKEAIEQKTIVESEGNFSAVEILNNVTKSYQDQINRANSRRKTDSSKDAPQR